MMTMTRSLPAAVCAALLLLTSGAFAQKAALVQEINDGARVPYQQSLFASNCNFAGDCAVVFPAVPSGHRVVVENISCFASLVAGALVGPFTLGSQTFRNARVFVPAVAMGNSSYAANASTLLYYEAGEQPRVDTYSSAAYSSFICTLTGRDVTLS